jgi:prevent-host-death family protein
MAMSSREIGLREARAQLGELVTAAQYGHTTIITRNGKPIARIAPLEDAMPATTTPTDATEWADALDAEMSHTGQSAGDLISHGYANGQIAGIELDPEHPDADDERGVIASTSGWVVRYDAQTKYWTAD